jgi:hypothetical protein
MVFGNIARGPHAINSNSTNNSNKNNNKSQTTNKKN